MDIENMRFFCCQVYIGNIFRGYFIIDIVVCAFRIFIFFHLFAGFMARQKADLTPCGKKAK